MVQLFGDDGKKELNRNRKRIGALIGQQAYYPNMTVLIWGILIVIALEKLSVIKI